MKFLVTVQQDEDGMYVSSCPRLPGCHSQGRTYDEAVVNIKDAIELYIEDLTASGDPLPPPQKEEVVDVEIRKAG